MKSAPSTLLAVLALSASALAQPVHSDKRWGFQIQYPKEWQLIPLKVDEKWIAAKYLSPREHADREGWGHTPMMTVILFPEDQTKKRGPSVTREGNKVTIDFTIPFKDYPDYLKSSMQGEGYFVAEEKEDIVGDVPVRKRDIKVHKPSYGGPKRILAWVYEGMGVDYAVQFEVLEDRWDRMRPTILACLNSFKLIEREVAARSETKERDLPISGPEYQRLSPEQRKARRVQTQEAVFDRAQKGLPEGWKVKRTPHFLVLTHADDKYTGRVIAQAEAVRAWLDKELEDIGTDYVMHGIIRVCANDREQSAYHKSSTDAYSMKTREVTIAKDTSWAMRWEFEWLTRGILQQWLSDKNADLWAHMPTWLSSGLGQYLGTARVRGGKLEFKPDDWEMQNLRDGGRRSMWKKLRQLLVLPEQDFNAGENTQFLPAQAASFLRWLDGPGRASKKTKTLLRDYVRNLSDVVADIQTRKKASAGGSSAPDTEEEEEERYKRMRSEAKTVEKQVLGDAFRLTFESWTDQDWEWLEGAWARFAS